MKLIVLIVLFVAWLFSIAPVSILRRIEFLPEILKDSRQEICGPCKIAVTFVYGAIILIVLSQF